MSDGRARWYVVVDVETTGPVPGPYSLAALGFVIVDAETLDRVHTSSFRLRPFGSLIDDDELPWSWDFDTRAWWDSQPEEIRREWIGPGPGRVDRDVFVELLIGELDAYAPTSRPDLDRFLVASPASFDVAWLDYTVERPGRKLWSHRTIDVRSVLWGDDPSIPWGEKRTDDPRWVIADRAHDPVSDATALAKTLVRFIARRTDRPVPGWAE